MTRPTISMGRYKSSQWDWLSVEPLPADIYAIDAMNENCRIVRFFVHRDELAPAPDGNLLAYHITSTLRIKLSIAADAF